MQKRDLLNVKGLSAEEIDYLLDLATKLKSGQTTSDALKGKSVALVFQKPSNRTRVSFEVAVAQLGGTCIYLGPEEINLGKRETTADVAHTLARYVQAIVARTFSHQDVLDLAKYASVPVINGLSDISHPCQALADILSIKEKFGQFKNLKLAYIGDGNNVYHSLLLASAKVGLNMTAACPKGYDPVAKIVSAAQEVAKSSKAEIKLTRSPQEAVKGAQVIYTDTWVSMGQETETKKRLKDFKDYQINDKLTKLAAKDYIFMHCLPAHRGQEVTGSIIDGPHSIIFDQAENRKHIQKAILLFLLGENK